MITGVIAAGATGAALLIHQPTPFQSKPSPPAAAPSSTRAIPQSLPTISASMTPAPVSYPSDFTNQDRAFVDQALARGLATPKTIAGLPDFAHWACTGFRDSLAGYLRIEDAALAWDAPNALGANPLTPPIGAIRSWTWPSTITARPCGPRESTHPRNDHRRTPRFSSGWYDMAPKRGLVVATAAMMRRAQEVCAELQTTPDWEVIPHVDARMAGNNPDFKKKFVALARKSYCPKS